MTNWWNFSRTLMHFHLFLESYNTKTKFHMNFEFFMKSFSISLIWKHENQFSLIEKMYQLYQEIHVKAYWSQWFKEDLTFYSIWSFEIKNVLVLFESTKMSNFHMFQDIFHTWNCLPKGQLMESKTILPKLPSMSYCHFNLW